MRKPIVSLLGTTLLAIAATAANAQSTIHLYIYDTHTGAVTQASPAMDFEPYNASFSNNGKKLVHDLVMPGGPAQTLGVTDLTTGTMTPLGLEGDSAHWSPNGKYIAYTNYQDWVDSGFDPNVPVQLRIVPASGGTPITVLDWATDGSWSNNSRRLAFWGWDNEIGTVGLDGTVTRFDYAAGNRGKHILTQRPDGSPQCIACNMCATVCPAKVIEIEAAFDPSDAAHPKYPARFEIDYSRCVFCGLCVEACPEDAIRMVKEVPELPSMDRDHMWLKMDELLTWRPQSDVAKPYPPKAGGPA